MLILKMTGQQTGSSIQINCTNWFTLKWFKINLNFTITQYSLSIFNLIHTYIHNLDINTLLRSPYPHTKPLGQVSYFRLQI